MAVPGRLTFEFLSQNCIPSLEKRVSHEAGTQHYAEGLFNFRLYWISSFFVYLCWLSGRTWSFALAKTHKGMWYTADHVEARPRS